MNPAFNADVNSVLQRVLARTYDCTRRSDYSDCAFGTEDAIKEIAVINRTESESPRHVLSLPMEIENRPIRDTRLIHHSAACGCTDEAPPDAGSFVSQD